MKIITHLILLTILLVSCKDVKTKTTEKNSTTTKVKEVAKESNESVRDIRKREKEVYKALKKKTQLTGEQMLAVIPNKFNGFDRLSNMDKSKFNFASAYYGPLKGLCKFYIEDGAGAGTDIVRNLSIEYDRGYSNPNGATRSYFKIRDGYKTVGTMDDAENETLSFIYGKRFRITVQRPTTGDLDDLWSKIDFENLKKLDQYQ